MGSAQRIVGVGCRAVNLEEVGIYLVGKGEKVGWVVRAGDKEIWSKGGRGGGWG